MEIVLQCGRKLLMFCRNLLSLPSTQRMEAAGFSEVSVNLCPSTQLHSPEDEDGNLEIQCLHNYMPRVGQVVTEWSCFCISLF